MVSGDYTKTMYVVRVHIHSERYRKIVTVMKEKMGWMHRSRTNALVGADLHDNAPLLLLLVVHLAVDGGIYGRFECR